MRLFSGTNGHKKPNSKKNMFQNYADHINYVEIESAKIWKKLDGNNMLGILITESMKRIRIFEALRDGHDYFDEVLGAFVGSTLCNIATLGLVAYAAWEMATALLMKTGLLTDDEQNHVHNALKGVFCAMTTFVMSLVIHLKSMISMITRPLVTLLFGNNNHTDVNRFYDNETFDTQDLQFVQS
jgi:hypothetical protein